MVALEANIRCEYALQTRAGPSIDIAKGVTFSVWTHKNRIIRGTAPVHTRTGKVYHSQVNSKKFREDRRKKMMNAE